MDNVPEEMVAEQSSDPIEEENNLPSIDNELRQFIDNITSISGTLGITMQAIFRARNKTKEQLFEFRDKNISYQEENGKTKIVMKADCYQTYSDLTRQFRTYRLALKTIPRSYVMALISQFDAFLGKLLRIIILRKPEMLNASEKSLSFAQLVEFGSVEDAKEFILEKEIETVIRKSHAEQFDWMERKFDISLRKGLDVWPSFIELTERRNLFVHTDGIVSDQYLKVCREHRASINEIKKGDELDVSPEYFFVAYEVIFEIAFKLAHVLWRKFMPDELMKADSNLIDIGYDTLHDENYKQTALIFDFATQTLKKYSSEYDRLIMVVNRALAYKWGGNDKKARGIITQEDWSATSGRFRLAEAVILENYELAYDIMQEIGQNFHEVGLYDYREWPLFKEIRKENKFLELIEKIFGEPYNKVEPENLNLPGDLESETMAEFQSDNANCD